MGAVPMLSLSYTPLDISSNGTVEGPPANWQTWEAVIQRVIEHYSGLNNYNLTGVYYEVWNEPDSSVYWKDQDGLKSYCKLLKEVYTAAKSVDPECIILNGGLANGASSINLLYDNGAGPYFDILNIHYFRNPLYPASQRGLDNFPRIAYKIMSRNNDGNKKIWITEIGCPGVGRGSKVTDWWLGKNPNEEQQAAWVNVVYSELLKYDKVEKIFWAFFRDCDCHWGTGVDYFGLVRWDFSCKPAYFAYENCYQRWKKGLSQ